MNPAAIMKLMGAYKQFSTNHPKFTAFLSAVMNGGVPEGSVIEITVTRPGEAPLTSNLRVQQSDLELLSSLKDISMK